MYCHYKNHDFEDQEAMKRELVVVHFAHLLVRDSTLQPLADLPVDMGAESATVGSEWIRFADFDDD